jgi:hypothetical protein
MLAPLYTSPDLCVIFFVEVRVLQLPICISDGVQWQILSVVNYKTCSAFHKLQIGKSYSVPIVNLSRFLNQVP